MKNKSTFLVWALVLLSSVGMSLATTKIELGGGGGNGGTSRDDKINLTSFFNSDIGVPLTIIGLIVVFDVFLTVFFLGQASRRAGTEGQIRRAFNRLRVPKRKRRPHHHQSVRTYGQPKRVRPYFSVGRIGETIESVPDFAAKAYESLDLVDTTFGVMNVESESCRQKAVCEMERAAADNAFLGFVVRNLNSYVKGFDKYQEAIALGKAAQDCTLYYPECQYSLADSFSLFRRRK